MRTAIGLIAVVGLASAASAMPFINEFQPNPAGQDPAMTQVEIKGTPGMSFSGWLHAIDSDVTSGAAINDSNAVSGTFDANGLLVVTIPDIENPSFTLVLNDTEVSAGTNVDSENGGDGDGVLDNIATFGTVFDAVDILDIATDFTYADDFGIADAAIFIGFEPVIAWREATTMEWYASGNTEAFDANGNVIPLSSFDKDPLATTFGEVNPAIPAPGALALLSLGGFAVARRRR